MKQNAILLTVLGAFFFVVDVAYVIWALLVDGYVEPVGTVGIGLAAIMAWFPAFFLFRSAKAAPNLPEDNYEANIEDGDAEVGFFLPTSWWPIVLAGACALTALGLAIGWWLAAIGVATVIVAAIGWSFETNRGHYAH